MRNLTVSSIICLFLAILLGIFAQDAAYLLHDIVPSVYPIYFLTGITIASIFILLGTVIMIVWGRKKYKKLIFQRFLIVVFITGVSTTLWSLFVLAAWWNGM